MSYKMEFKSDAIKFIHKQSKSQQIRILSSINQLPSGDVKKLLGLKNENLYRLRVRLFQNNLFYKH